MPRTSMSDTPLSPVNEYYKVLNKRIMEEKTAEMKVTRKSITQGYEDPYTGNLPHYKYFRDHVRLNDFDGICDVNTSIDEVCFMLKGYADQQAASLQSTLDRYEKALREIADNPLRTSHVIASNALNNK